MEYVTSHKMRSPIWLIQCLHVAYNKKMRVPPLLFVEVGLGYFLLSQQNLIVLSL
ncbi:hypothetical protein GNE08_24750 [Trichormus variabilis ARAD]|uniref:Uncharacterized protein n=1 Tax=Trichormus variabilis N2B TaxID=2681315 RepID=A0ABR6S780_ANAVA|nr:MULTISPECIES: hypothetical protein [Nostocaceae]MBC1217418.1 hypothetical protein [Trichormus variabilis ARAD]MBC1258163.1 hypothetical protein [Trichormus variabilis V5]MBC1270240.1 hypothetical protein [Trichormus variabilis FSR]MBC1302256.1 hypothetical protein [Trichormus variabilis N2B]MBC1314283.1 hypothetical protein [Trichormus variabilis PNB]